MESYHGTFIEELTYILLIKIAFCYIIIFINMRHESFQSFYFILQEITYKYIIKFITRDLTLFYTFYIFVKQMLLLFCLAYLLLLHPTLANNPQHLLIFANDGTYYQFWPQSKKVSWHNSLNSSLLSFEMGNQKAQKPPSLYIVPTIDGHFLYIDSQSEILINRKEVEELMRVCLQTKPGPKVEDPSVQYFVYQRFQYYIINLLNGHAQDIQTFLKNGIPKEMERMAILKVSKKYLKQLKNDLTIAWSTISSQLDLAPANLFLNNPQATFSHHPSHINSQYHFRRIDQNEIQMLKGQQSFRLGGKSHIFKIFQYINQQKGYLNHAIPYHNSQKLALSYITSENNQKINHIASYDKQVGQNTGFLHSEAIKHSQQTDKTNLETCINTYRTLRAITDESKGHIPSIISDSHFPFIAKTSNNQFLSNYSLIFSQQQTFKQQLEGTYGPTRDQPYVWIALLIVVFLGSFGLYRIKINTFISQMSAKQENRDKKLEQLQQKLGQMSEMTKMYQVYWDKVAYRVAGQIWFQHIVFQGKFLNQSAFVYAVRLEGTDIVTLQHKLNTLLNFSYSSLCKLYYYTKNSQFLLIFSQRLEPLSSRVLPNHLDVQMPLNAKKNAITQMIESVAYLDSKIQINWLPFQALSIQPKVAQDEAESYYEIKLNALPCMLRRNTDESDQEESRSYSSESNTRELRQNIVKICNLIINQGQPFNKEAVDQKLKNQAYSQDQYLQFYDFVLYQARQKLQVAERQLEGGGSENLRQIMFKEILDHPYLWDSKRKILFLSDFSNYIETHIDDFKVKKLQNHAKQYNVIKTPWIKEFHFMFVKEVSNYRKYDYESVRDLIRVIRNKLNHFHEIPKEVRQHVGKTPQGFIEYCLDLFPKLLHFAFVYTRKKKWKLHMK